MATNTSNATVPFKNSAFTRKTKSQDLLNNKYSANVTKTKIHSRMNERTVIVKPKLVTVSAKKNIFTMKIILGKDGRSGM
jgi:hypothetical protein